MITTKRLKRNRMKNSNIYIKLTYIHNESGINSMETNILKIKA